MTNTNKKEITFPIWEKVYADIKDPEFFENIKSIQIKNEIFIFPSTYEKSQSRKYFIFNIDNETIRSNEMEYDCFYPIFDKNSSIYLFRIDESFTSDNRYHIVEYNIENREWRQLKTFGVAPKKRTDDFTAFYYQEKIYFLGGLQIYPADTTGSLVYSFCTVKHEWNIETYTGTFPASEPNKAYFGNKGGMNGVLFCNKQYLFGGKIIENCLTETNNNLKSYFNENETNDLYEFDLTKLEFRKTPIATNLVETIKFYNHSTCLYRDYMYIYSKGKFYCYDIFEVELSMLKPLLFNPESIKDTIMFTNNQYIYIIGRMKNYDDCIIFKTNINNLSLKWDYTKSISYENLLNNKDWSDSVIVIDKKEIFVNKILFFNMSSRFKSYMQKCSNNNFTITDSNYIAVFNCLKLIYYNFNDTLNNMDFKIIGEVMIFLYNYKSTSLLNKISSVIKLNSENALQLYDLATKLNLAELKNNCFNYIADNLDLVLSKNHYESLEIKRLLYSNYFCKHKFVISANCLGFDVKEMDSQNVSNELLQELKNMTKDSKLCFCMGCKKIINNVNSKS